MLSVANATIIPVGKIIQYFRENIKEFDYQNNGLSLCRDGFHLSYDYGRFIAAATWFMTLTGIKLNLKEFRDFDVSLINLIASNLNSIL